MEGSAPVPRDIRRAGPDRIVIEWSDGRVDEHRAFDLRVACPCASCVDELTGERLLDPARVPEGVRPVRIQSVGRYALKFEWSDGHDTGLYTFERLRRLGASP